MAASLSRHPQGRTVNPQRRTVNPLPLGIYPQRRKVNPQREGIHPQWRKLNPQREGIHPQWRKVNPQREGIHPQRRKVNPLALGIYPQPLGDDWFLPQKGDFPAKTPVTAPFWLYENASWDTADGGMAEQPERGRGVDDGNEVSMLVQARGGFAEDGAVGLFCGRNLTGTEGGSTGDKDMGVTSALSKAPSAQ